MVNDIAPTIRIRSSVCLWTTFRSMTSQISNTFSIMTLSMTTKNATLSVTTFNDLMRSVIYAESRYVECRCVTNAPA